MLAGGKQSTTQAAGMAEGISLDGSCAFIGRLLSTLLGTPVILQMIFRDILPSPKTASK